MLTVFIFIELALIVGALVVVRGVDGSLRDFIETLAIFNGFVGLVGVVAYGVCFALALGL